MTYCFGRALYSESVTNIMKTHRYVRQIANNELSEFESYPIMKALSELDLGPCHIDVGKLALKYMEASAGNGTTAMDFVKQQCAEVIGRHVPPLAKPQDVVLYGFGRIGRLLARLLIEKTGGGQQLRLRAIVVRKATKEDLGETREPVAARFGARIVQRHDPRRPRQQLHHRERQRHSHDLREQPGGSRLRELRHHRCDRDRQHRRVARPERASAST